MHHWRGLPEIYTTYVIPAHKLTGQLHLKIKKYSTVLRDLASLLTFFSSTTLKILQTVFIISVEMFIVPAPRCIVGVVDLNLAERGGPDEYWHDLPQ